MDICIPTPHKHVDEKTEQMEEEAREVQEDEPLSPSSMILHESSFSLYIVALIASGKTIDVDVVKAGLEATLLRHPRFSSVQVFGGGEEGSGKGQARWVRTEVKLEEHVIVPDLDPSAIDSPDRFVEDYMSSLSGSTAPRLDPSKPLWELHVLNLRTSDAEATAIFRIHHSLGDGASLVSLLLACTRKTSDPSALPSIPEPSRYRPFFAKSRRCGFLLWLLLLFRVVWNTLFDVAAFIATFMFLRDSDTPIKGAEGCELSRKRFVRRSFPFDDLKAVKLSMKNVTVNDVLLGVFSAGLSRYLFRRSGVADGGNACFGGGGRVRIRSALIFNIRKTPGIHVLADMMESAKVGANWGNHLGYVLLPFQIAKHEDPLNYVMEAKKLVDRKKESLEAYFSFLCGKLILKLFGFKVAGAVTHKILANTTLSFSNVIGPVEEIGFYNHPIVYLAPTVYGHPQALTVHFFSYMGKITMVLAVDESVIPDPHQLCEDILESVSLIKEAAAGKESLI